jgi:gluconokinase
VILSTRILIVMGVSGSGKSTVALQLAKTLGWQFAEGDDFHPPANIAKMRSGQPLDDGDRMPWLASIATWIDGRREAGEPAIVSCSALKHSYRDLLAAHRSDVLFVYLKGTMEVVSHHLATRAGHFMPASLLPTQFETLEEPTADEHFIAVEASRPVSVIVAEIEAYLKSENQPKRPVT